ncbi:MAG: hypothetical protein ABSH20_12840 [Tepidisphaeraceae bacterium]|jgi:hypothetical protein
MAEAPDSMDPRRLSLFLESMLEDRSVWQPGDLGDLLRQELEQPLQFGLSGLSPARAEQLRSLCQADGLTIKSLAEVLLHPRPPLDLLVLFKRFAHAHGHDPDSRIPADVARLLYLACIVAARLRCGQRITRLSDQELCDGIRTALAQPWLDERLAGLFRQGLVELEQKT